MKITLSLLIAASSLALAGCSQITKENYQALEMGQDYSAVELILGAPTACQETLVLKQCQWGNEQRFIDIKFVADKVTFYSHQGVK
ncbi:MAG: DUF3862 domain-containing protein [Gammaproteobacteria bacterium]|nr:DUF3862 domain-containing protein [Gammaproteobacteria bacterium]